MASYSSITNRWILQRLSSEQNFLLLSMLFSLCLVMIMQVNGQQFGMVGTNGQGYPPLQQQQQQQYPYNSGYGTNGYPNRNGLNLGYPNNYQYRALNQRLIQRPMIGNRQQQLYPLYGGANSRALTLNRGGLIRGNRGTMYPIQGGGYNNRGYNNGGGEYGTNNNNFGYNGYGNSHGFNQMPPPMYGGYPYGNNRNNTQNSNSSENRDD